MAGVVLATAGYDHTIRFWEAASGTCNRTVKYGDSQVNCLQITPDKKYIAAAGNPHIRLFEINSNNPNHVTSYDGHSGNVTAIGFQKHGKWMYSCSDDRTLKIWDLRAPACQRNYECGVPLNSVVLHPNQAELMVADQNGCVRIYDLAANAMSAKLVPDGETALRSLDVMRDGSAMVVANNTGKCFVYRPTTASTSSPEQNSLPGTNSSSWTLEDSFQAHDAYILKVKLSANGKYLATCSSDKTAKIWNMEVQEKTNPSYGLIHTLQGHQRWVWDCSFSAVSSYLVTCSSDQTARLWDLSQGEAIRNYTGHHKAVICVALNDSVVE